MSKDALLCTTEVHYTINEGNYSQIASYQVASDIHCKTNVFVEDWLLHYHNFDVLATTHGYS